MSKIPVPMANEESTKSTRQSPLKDKKRSEFRFPGNDFAHFMEQRKPGGEGTGSATLRHVMRESLREVGAEAHSRIPGFNKLMKQMDALEFGGTENMPESMKAMAESMEYGMKANMRYLELQFNMQFGSRSFSTVSNVMKKRNESIKASFNEIK